MSALRTYAAELEEALTIAHAEIEALREENEHLRSLAGMPEPPEDFDDDPFEDDDEVPAEVLAMLREMDEDEPEA